MTYLTPQAYATLADITARHNIDIEYAFQLVGIGSKYAADLRRLTKPMPTSFVNRLRSKIPLTEEETGLLESIFLNEPLRITVPPHTDISYRNTLTLHFKHIVQLELTADELRRLYNYALRIHANNTDNASGNNDIDNTPQVNEASYPDELPR